MKSLARLRYLRITGFAVGAVAVAVAAVVITASAAGLNFGFRPASSAGPTPSPKAATALSVCNDFLSHFASDLGKSPSQVNSAFQKAVGETLADQVSKGQLTQAQVDAIQKKLAGKPPCALAGGLGRSKHHGPKAPINTAQLLSAAAAALGISDAQLKSDLAGGMTLSEIAAAQHPPVTEAQFRTRLIAGLKPLLDTAVANKQLTSAQEQAIIQRLQTGPIPFWNTPMGHKAGAASPSPNQS